MSGVPAVGQLAKVLKLGTCTIRSASLVSRDATASTCAASNKDVQKATKKKTLPNAEKRLFRSGRKYTLASG